MLMCSILAVMRRHGERGGERTVEPEDMQAQSQKETKSRSQSQQAQRRQKKGTLKHIYISKFKKIFEGNTLGRHEKLKKSGQKTYILT